MTSSRAGKSATVFSILFAVSFCHLLNDMVQSLIPSIYPILKSSYQLSFGQLGFLTLGYQLTASLLQPFIGLYTDRKPQPYSLPIGVTFTIAGLFLLGSANSFATLLIASCLVGIGSAVFHPESSRVARLASGGQHGLAQSVFQLGGTFGSSLGPLLAAVIVLRRGQHTLGWFSIPVAIGALVLLRVAAWYKRCNEAKPGAKQKQAHHNLTQGKIRMALIVLIALVFSKYFYLACLSSYYTFFLVNKFHVSVGASQLYLFLFLGSGAVGTFVGGPVGDRVGRKKVIWISILGTLPFALLLPYVNLLWTAVLSVVIGLVISSAFSAILVYAQELLPGRVGAVSGLFFGLAFGMGGIGAAVLGALADHTGIQFVYELCSYLPAIGLLTALLPELERRGPMDHPDEPEMLNPPTPAASRLSETVDSRAT